MFDFEKVHLSGASRGTPLLCLGCVSHLKLKHEPLKDKLKEFFALVFPPPLVYYDFFLNGYYLRLCEFTFVNSESSSASERARSPLLGEDARASHGWIRSVDHGFKVEGSRFPSGSPQMSPS